MSETIANPQQHNREESLLYQIEILNALASMDSIEYHQRLVENTLPTIQEQELSKLSLIIGRNHSLIQNMTNENDLQTKEILELQNQNQSLQSHIKELHRVVSKLHSQNLRLKKRRKSDKSVARRLVEQMKVFDAARMVRKEEKELKQLFQHEQFLRDGSNSSNFSEVDGFQDFDNGSMESSLSVRSLVTSEPPTVRIHRQRTLTWPYTNFTQLVYDNQEDISTSKGKKVMRDQNRPKIDIITIPTSKPYPNLDGSKAKDSNITAERQGDSDKPNIEKFNLLSIFQKSHKK